MRWIVNSFLSMRRLRRARLLIPSAGVFSAHTGKRFDRSRVKDIREISGNGVTATVDGIEVAAGNSKLMDRLGVKWIDCHQAGTIIHMAVDGQIRGTYCNIRY